MAARTHSYTQRGRSNNRVALAAFFGFAAAIVVPLAIELTRKVHGADLLDAVWAIPVAGVAAVASFVLARGAARGSRFLTAARVLAITGICLTLSSALAVGIYEYLLHIEK